MANCKDQGVVMKRLTLLLLTFSGLILSHGAGARCVDACQAELQRQRVLAVIACTQRFPADQGMRDDCIESRSDKLNTEYAVCLGGCSY